jgi:hypothetical protein
MLLLKTLISSCQLISVGVRKVQFITGVVQSGLQVLKVSVDQNILPLPTQYPAPLPNGNILKSVIRFPFELIGSVESLNVMPPSVDLNILCGELKQLASQIQTLSPIAQHPQVLEKGTLSLL